MHGGGFAIGGLDSHAGACAALAAGTGYRVLAVTYGLAPERPHPAAHDDVWAAYQALLAPGAPAALGLGASPRVILCGDSAGGMLAIALALRIREHNERRGAGGALVPPVALVPFYPAVDSSVLRPSRHKYAEGFVLSHSMYARFGRLMLGETRAERARFADDPLLHPLRTREWKGLPPTLVCTAEHDILHDEGVALVDAMRAGGARAEHIAGAGLIHGFVTEQASFPAAAAVVAAVCERVRAMVDEAERGGKGRRAKR